MVFWNFKKSKNLQFWIFRYQITYSYGFLQHSSKNRWASWYNQKRIWWFYSERIISSVLMSLSSYCYVSRSVLWIFVNHGYKSILGFLEFLKPRLYKLKKHFENYRLFGTIANNHQILITTSVGKLSDFIFSNFQFWFFWKFSELNNNVWFEFSTQFYKRLSDGFLDFWELLVYIKTKFYYILEPWLYIYIKLNWLFDFLKEPWLYIIENQPPWELQVIWCLFF